MAKVASSKSRWAVCVCVSVCVCVCVGGGSKKFGNQFITVKSDPIWTGVELNAFSFWPQGAGPAGKVQICSLPLTLGTGLKLLPMPGSSTVFQALDRKTT